jgi:hypothetical protein
MIGLDLLDIAADPAAYLLARDRLRARGHLVLLVLPDGVPEGAADLRALAPDQIEHARAPGRCRAVQA